MTPKLQLALTAGIVAVVTCGYAISYQAHACNITDLTEDYVACVEQEDRQQDMEDRQQEMQRDMQEQLDRIEQQLEELGE
jgi:hypothetical protein